MYQVMFPPQSNRASWVFLGEITDLQDEPIDLAGCTLTFSIREKNRGSALLTASTTDGSITYPDIGRFRWFFTLDQMRSLCAGHYDTGLTLMNDDGTQTVQLSVGPLPIVDGVVP